MSTLKIVTADKARDFVARLATDIKKETRKRMDTGYKNLVLSTITTAFEDAPDTKEAKRFCVRISIAMTEYRGRMQPLIINARKQLFDALKYYQHPEGDEEVEDLKGEWEEKQRGIVPFAQHMAMLKLAERSQTQRPEGEGGSEAESTGDDEGSETESAGDDEGSETESTGDEDGSGTESAE